MKLALVNTGNDPEIGGNAYTNCYPPLGIISLATAVLDRCGSIVTVALHDGQIETTEEICNKLSAFKPDVVGVSMYCTSVNNSIAILKHAKYLGALTIAGNDHAAFHYEELLKRNNEIDLVCTEDIGEPVISSVIESLLGNKDIYSNEGIAYRDNGKIKKNKCSNGSYATKYALDKISIPKRTLLPSSYWETYTSNFKNLYRRTLDTSSVTGVATINRARGCARSSRRCKYCGIADLSIRGSSADAFWKDVQAARDDVNANYLYEAFDSATSWPKLIESWADSKPKHLADTKLLMYAQANETSPRTVEAFQRLGVVCVNIGIDSGDDHSLHLLKGPNNSLIKNRDAALLWTAANIEMHVSFVLVGLGDDSKTIAALERTLEFAKWLVQNTSTVTVEGSLLFPDLSSKIGEWITNPNIAKKEADKMGWGFIDYDRLNIVSNYWKDNPMLSLTKACQDFAWICRTDHALLQEYCDKLSRVCKENGVNFGLSQGGRLL